MQSGVRTSWPFETETRSKEFGFALTFFFSRSCLVLFGKFSFSRVRDELVCIFSIVVFFFLFLFLLFLCICFGICSVIKFWPQVNPTLDGKIIIKIWYWMSWGFNSSYVLKCCANLRGQHVRYRGTLFLFGFYCVFPFHPSFVWPTAESGTSHPYQIFHTTPPMNACNCADETRRHNHSQGGENRQTNKQWTNKYKKKTNEMNDTDLTI